MVCPWIQYQAVFFMLPDIFFYFFIFIIIMFLLPDIFINQKEVMDSRLVPSAQDREAGMDN